MGFKDLADMNNKRFLREAFDAKRHNKLIRAARFRRNTYLVLFIVGVICIFLAGFARMPRLSILSLFLATLSLVVMTKYDTQVFFLEVIEERENADTPS